MSPGQPSYLAARMRALEESSPLTSNTSLGTEDSPSASGVSAGAEVSSSAPRWPGRGGGKRRNVPSGVLSPHARDEGQPTTSARDRRRDGDREADRGPQPSLRKARSGFGRASNWAPSGDPASVAAMRTLRRTRGPGFSTLSPTSPHDVSSRPAHVEGTHSERQLVPAGPQAAAAAESARLFLRKARSLAADTASASVKSPPSHGSAAHAPRHLDRVSGSGAWRSVDLATLSRLRRGRGDEGRAAASRDRGASSGEESASSDEGVVESNPMSKWASASRLAFSGLPRDGPCGGRIGLPEGSDVDLTRAGFLGGQAPFSVRSRIGWAQGRWKPENQDTFLAEEASGEGILAVFDGHGRRGRDVSRAVRGLFQVQLPRVAGKVAAHAASTAATEEALRSAFASVDKSLSSMGLDTEASGCTAAVALLDPTAPRVAVAWCGDSRIVLGRDTRHPGRSAATDGAAGAQAPVQWAEGRGREALTTGGAQAAYESDGEHLRLDDSVEHGADAVLTLDAQAGRASGRVSSRVGADAAGPVSVGPSGVDAHGLRRGLAGPAAGRGMKDSDDAGLGDAARAFESLTLSDGTEGGAEATLLSPPGRLTPLSPSSPQPVDGIEAVDLTHDHKPDLPEELRRIEDADGRVLQVTSGRGAPGPFRIFLQTGWVPGLSTSRAFGDAIARRVGVISKPDVRVVDLSPADRWLVLATDGVWEAMESQEVVDICARHQGSPADATKAIVAECLDRWADETDSWEIDDITVIVVEMSL